MTGKKKEKRRRPVACLRYRRMLMRTSLFSLVVLLCCCCEPAQASSADSGNSNSNSNDARQPEEMPPADVVDNDPGVDAAGDAASVPGRDSIEDKSRINARSGHVEDAEELGMPSTVATPGVDEGEGEDDGGGSVSLTPADPAASGAVSLAGASASSSGTTGSQRATQAGAASQEDAVDIMQQHDVAAAVAAHSATGPVDLDADTPSSTATPAADAIQGSELDQNSHQHDTNVLAVGDEGGDSGGGRLGVSTGFDAGREKELPAAEATSAPGVDTAEDRARNEGEIQDEALRLEGDGGKEAGGARDETDRPCGMDELVEETKEASVRTPSGTSSPPESAAAVADELDEELLKAEGSGGSYSGGDAGGGADDHGVADGGTADGHRPEEDSEVETETGDHSSSRTSGGSGGRRDAKEYKRPGGQGEKKEVRESREEVYPHHGGDGVDGGDASGSSSGAAGFPRGSPEDMAQRVRDMEAELVRKLLAEEDAKSLLDIWVERTREYVLTQTVPPTDAECDFNWSRLRCEPKCTCGARLRFGDYTPGRACRLLHPWERNPELCGSGVDGDDGGGSGGSSSDGGGGAWDPSDEPAVRRVVAAAAGALGGLRQAYEERVAPPSDSECSFSFETRRCEPQPLCRLRFRWGDLTPSSACRLAGGASSDEKKYRASAPTHKSPGGGTFH
ncbi:conserved unknown protein [Ectocarpus siliculosus]|uniref:Uncharacterized protein n=1 Tax=Ectocarpus siliculosus TaxID=2880 RepID=D7FHY4_ECTSI|nr:conserved unknown protein [Ectocarpus siliculosus]|eukprot:CBJ48995.1 conserved unknown protein [Ectocarpus siliculosus]